MPGDALGEHRREVAGHDPRRLRVAAALGQLAGEAGDRAGVAPEGADHGPLAPGAGEAGRVVVPAPPGRLVDADVTHAREVGLSMGLGDDPVGHRPGPRVVPARRPRHAPRGHRGHRHGRHLGPEEGGEVPGVGIRPRDPCARRAALVAAEARQPAVGVGLVLPYARVAPRALARVAGPARRPAPGAPRRVAGGPPRAGARPVGIGPAPSRLDTRDGPPVAQVRRLGHEGRRHPRLGTRHDTPARPPTLARNDTAPPLGKLRFPQTSLCATH